MSDFERWRRYEKRKKAFLVTHPGATADEIEDKCRQIAKEEGV